MASGTIALGHRRTLRLTDRLHAWALFRADRAEARRRLRQLRFDRYEAAATGVRGA
jgi:hypothetical protein